MNSHVIEDRVTEYAKEHNLFCREDKVIVTLSGGADSVALLRVLLACGVKCSVLHCNFHLRGEESDRDEAFVRNLCETVGVSLKVKHFDVAEYERQFKVSTEMACRELRYAWFEDERVLQGATAIAVAHHYDDSVETFFLNMLRGTGIQGLTGIKSRNGYIIRPLLCLSRVEIESYLIEIGQDYVTDSTNLENDFKRNKIRNKLIPMLKDLFPDYVAGMSRTMQNMQGCNDLYQHAVDKLRNELVDNSKAEVISIDLASLSDIKEGRATAVYELIKVYGFNSQDAESINKYLNENRTETRTFLSHGYEADLKKTILEIYPITDADVAVDFINLKDLFESDNCNLEFRVSIEKKEKGQKRIPGIDGQKTIALNVDILKEEPMLVARRWKQGDRISPYGMNGSKLVSDLFSDNKYTVHQKNKTRILTTRSGEVLWVMNIRASRLYQVKADDEQFIKITLK